MFYGRMLFLKLKNIPVLNNVLIICLSFPHHNHGHEDLTDANHAGGMKGHLIDGRIGKART